MAMDSKQRHHKSEIEGASAIIENNIDPVSTAYSSAYVDAVFAFWYSKGKLSATDLQPAMPEPSEFGIMLGKPAVTTLRVWIRDFQDRAIALDDEVERQMTERLIAEKVKMLESHARIAEDMQLLALKVLHDPELKIRAGDAVRLLVEGVRIERESRGIPRTLEKLSDQSDDELMSQLKELLTRGETTIMPLGDGKDAV